MTATMPTVPDDPYHFPPDLMDLVINAVRSCSARRSASWPSSADAGYQIASSPTFHRYRHSGTDTFLSRRATRLASFLSDTLMNTA